MDSLLAARMQMYFSLAFHIVFAALGIGMPLLMVIAEGLGLRSGQRHFIDLARKWGRATGVIFAVGAVSGTALSFELGLLWPSFMTQAGAMVGPAFAVEGFAFFVEAIFLGLYLYGWDRLSPKAHWLTGLPVAFAGMTSGVLVMAANAWMQSPVGYQVVNGNLIPTSAFAVFQSPAWFQMALHMTLAAYISCGFAVAGVYAVALLRGHRNSYNRAALTITMAVGGIAAILQPLSGDISAVQVARYQPEKLAAMEALFTTQPRAPLTILGIPDAQTGTVRWGIPLPGLLSLLAHRDLNATVTGLDAFPRDEWPNVLLTHWMFDPMVGFGMLLVLLTAWFWWARWRRPKQEPVWMLRALAIGSPLGILAMEAGWIVAEVGRQPWIIYRIMRTSVGLTPAAGIPATFFLFIVIYLALAIALVFLLRSLAGSGPGDISPAGSEEVPHVA